MSSLFRPTDCVYIILKGEDKKIGITNLPNLPNLLNLPNLPNLPNLHNLLSGYNESTLEVVRKGNISFLNLFFPGCGETYRFVFLARFHLKLYFKSL